MLVVAEKIYAFLLAYVAEYTCLGFEKHRGIVFDGLSRWKEISHYRASHSSLFNFLISFSMFQLPRRLKYSH